MWTRARGAWHPGRVKEALESRSAEAVGPVAWVVRRLTRVTSGGPYIPALDGLRWLAMALVFLQHFQLAIVSTTLDRSVSPDPGLRTLYDLRVGVELFFVISGFILGVPFVTERVLGKERVELRAYFLRRLTRIEPPYAIALALFTMGWLLVGREPEITLRHALASLFYVHNLVYGAFHPQAINMVTWSLEIEVQFYVLAPVLAGVFMLRSAVARAAVLGGGLALGSTLTCLLTTTGGVPVGCTLTLACYLQYFLVGFALADWYAHGGDRADRSTVADALAIPCLVAVPLLEQHPVLRAYLLPLACGGLCLSALHGRLHARLMSVPALVVVGGMCYTIYLYHGLLKAALGRVTIGLHASRFLGVESAVQIAVLVPPILVICGGLFLAFEKPFMSRSLFEAARRKLGLS